MRFLPNDLGNLDSVDWIPIDSLAAVIGDIAHFASSSRVANSTSGVVKVYNLVNPSPTDFASLVPSIKQYFAKDVKLEVRGFEEWLERLKKFDHRGEAEVQRLPALKMLEYFEGLVGTKSLVWETTSAEEVSKMVREMEPIRGDMMSTWLNGWNF